MARQQLPTCGLTSTAALRGWPLAPHDSVVWCTLPLPPFSLLPSALLPLFRTTPQQAVAAFIRPHPGQHLRAAWNAVHHNLGRLVLLTAWAAIWLGVVTWQQRGDMRGSLARWVAPLAGGMYNSEIEAVLVCLLLDERCVVCVGLFVGGEFKQRARGRFEPGYECRVLALPTTIELECSWCGDLWLAIAQWASSHHTQVYSPRCCAGHLDAGK